MQTNHNKTTQSKINIVRGMLARGATGPQINDTIKKKFGSGISTHTVSQLRAETVRNSIRAKRAPVAAYEAKVDPFILEQSPDNGETGEAERALAMMSLDPPPAKAKSSSMRRFVLERPFDPTGISGTGTVAEGVQFSSGHVTLHWLSQLETISVYGNAKVLEQLHGHDGSTTIHWLDP